MGCLMLLLYQFVPVSFTQYIKEAIIGPLPDPPGLKLKKEGLTANHSVVLVPGSVSGGLELWEGKECANSLFRKRLWGGSFGRIHRRPLCWAEHMSLDNETGLDPPGIRVRPVTGLVGADYFIPGYYLWAVLISNLAQIGYEEKTIYMATYDWRISFQNTQARDQTLSRLKINIELMVAENFGKRVVVVAHSMGVLYFLHFMKWVEAPVPMGGGGGPNWCARHIKAVMNIGGPFLGVPKAVAGLFSGEVKDVAAIRSIAPGSWLLDYLRLLTLRHVMRMTPSWDSTMSMIPKGGDTIWGGLDWSPEDRYDCIPKKNKSNVTQISADNRTVSVGSQYSHVHYGGIISFSKDVADSFHPRRKTNSGMLVISQIHLAKYGWSTMRWVGGPSKRLLTTKSTPLDPSLSCSVLLLRRCCSVEALTSPMGLQMTWMIPSISTTNTGQTR